MSADPADPADELVDVHAHFLTEAYVTAACRGGHEHPEGMPGWPSWTAAEHLALMDRTGVRTSILSISAPGTHFGDDDEARVLCRQVNSAAMDLVDRHRGRFAHFASLPFPDVTGSLTELVHALDVLGSDGVALLSNVHGIYLGDGRYEPVYAELDRRRAVVFVHPVSPPNWQSVALGRPRPMIEFLFDSARTAIDLLFHGVLTRYPNINWIFSHSGGVLPVLVERVELFRTGFMGVAEGPAVAQQLGGLWYDIAGTPFPNAVPALARAFGDQRVLYGSDCCWTPAAAVMSHVQAIDTAIQPDASTWRTLTTRNAQRLFPRLGRSAV